MGIPAPFNVAQKARFTMFANHYHQLACHARVAERYNTKALEDRLHFECLAELAEWHLQRIP